MRLVRGRDEWDVQLEGRIVRLDRPGAPPAIVRADSLDDARAIYREAIEARLAERYVEAADPAIDRDARLVYADELQLRGDPLGELIAVHGELAQLPPGADPKHRRRLENREAALRDEHHDAWFGKLARLVHKPSRKPPPVPVVEVAWRLGFAEEVRIRGAEQLPIHEVYARLRELPLSRQILKLVAGPPDTNARPGDDVYPSPTYAPLTGAMLEHGIPSRLRELVLGYDRVGVRPLLHVGDTRAVVEAAPALEVLRIFGGAGPMGSHHGDLGFASERLRVLELYDLAREDLPSLARAALPNLEELVLHPQGQTPLPAVVEVFPRLQRLTLASIWLDGAITDRRAQRKLIEYLIEAAPPSLRELALPWCNLDDHDLATLTERPGRLASLERLDLRRNRFSRHAVVAAKRRLPALRA